MKVWVVRHGQRETNRDELWTGWYDAKLTPQGREDAVRAGALLKGVQFDRVWSSDLSRAMETERIALNGAPCEISPLLREIDVGKLVLQPITVVTAEEKRGLIRDGYEAFGGEPIQSLYRRIAEFMQLLQTLDCKNIAVFTHAGWLHGFLNTVLEAKLPRDHILCRNCTVAIFEYENGRWMLHSWMNTL